MGQVLVPDKIADLSITGTYTIELPSSIDRNSHLIEGAASDFTASTDDVRLRLVYDGPARGWIPGDMS